MAIKFANDGNDHWGSSVIPNGSSQFWSSVNNCTSPTTRPHTGTRSIQCNPTTAAVGCVATLAAIVKDAGARIQTWFNFDTIPSASLVLTPIEVTQVSFATCFGVTVTPAGLLAIYDKNLVVQATGSTILTVNTWNRLSVTYTITSATVNTISVYLNGVLEVSATNLTVATTSNTVFFGYAESFPAAGTPLAWFDDIYIDDLTSGVPNDIRITNKRPFSNGTTNGFTTQVGAGGSGYGSGHAPQVNELPTSDTNGWSIVGAGSAVTEEYNIEAASVGDTDVTGATIVDIMGWIRAKATVAETGQLIIDNVATAQVFSSSISTSFRFAGKTTYPAGTGTDIGIITSTTISTVSLLEAGIFVLYTPATLASLSGAMLPLMGVG